MTTESFLLEETDSSSNNVWSPDIHTCPNCRHRFKETDPDVIKRGLWTLYPKNTLYKDLPLQLTPNESKFLYILAKSSKPVAVAKIGYRLSGLNADDLYNIASVYKYRIKRKLRILNIPDPIKTFRSEGYGWVD